MTKETDDRRLALGKELDSIAAAEQALMNDAITQYFDEVEKQAVDTLLGCDVLNDELRLKLTVIAQTVRKMNDFLHEKRDLRALVESELEALKG